MPPPGPDLALAHKVDFLVSDGEAAKWNLALISARNVQRDQGRDNVAIEIVAHGPGIGALKVDSVVGAHIAEALIGGLSAVACESTMKKQKISRDHMLPKIGYLVKAGAVQLMTRQKEGFAYVRP